MLEKIVCILLNAILVFSLLLEIAVSVLIYVFVPATEMETPRKEINIDEWSDNQMENDIGLEEQSDNFENSEIEEIDGDNDENNGLYFEEEREWRVLVKQLPVFKTGNISKNATDDPIETLYQGDTVSLMEDFNSEGYVGILMEDGNEGYVWFDAIGELTSAEYSEKKSKVVVIDAGHQAKPNSELEAVGPGSVDTKPKVKGGTSGVSSNVPEYKLNLQIALKTEAILEEKGYVAVMIRKENDVNISNVERAKVANQIEADAFVRIHANGSEQSSQNGSMTIINTSRNRYISQELYEQNKLLAESVIDKYTEKTGIKKNDILQSDTYSGINWCKVPVTILEMGFMTNPEEDLKMQDEEMQDKMAEGIALGIIEFLEDKSLE